MKIKKMLSQHRRDFRAIYVCESCNHEVESYGYDDAYFHSEVIPNMVCKACGESVAQYLTKRTQVKVSGDICTREYEGKTYVDVLDADVKLLGKAQSGGGSTAKQSEPANDFDDSGDIPF